MDIGDTKAGCMVSWGLLGFHVPFIVIYCHILLVRIMDTEFSKRCIILIKPVLNSENVIVKTIINVGLNGIYSIMGGYWRHFRSKYGMEECNVMESWDEKCKNRYESVRVCEQIREMCRCKDKCIMTLCEKEE